MGVKFFESPNCLLNRRNRYQLLTTLIINLNAIGHGIGIGWFSPTLRVLQSPETPLDFSIHIKEVSGIGSMLGMGAIIGNILIGLILERVGRKPCVLFLAIPYSCCWLLVYFAENSAFLYAARLLAGVASGGMYIVHPIFISEFADAQIRGSLGSMIFLFVNFGVLIGYTMGTYLPYSLVPWIVLTIPLSYFVCNLFIPETPNYLIRQGKYEAAEKSFRFFKNLRAHEGLTEFEELKLALTKHAAMEKDKLTWRDFVTPAARKAYVRACVVLLANQLSGIFAFVNYMSDIFAMSGTDLDPNTCTIIIGVVQIFGTYVTTLLCDIYGRKILLIVSSAGVALSLAAFGCFTHFAQHYDLTAWSWLPLVLMCLDIFMGNIGLVGCFYVVLIEVFPAKIRPMAASFAIVMCSILVFILLNITPLCLAYWGITATMWACAGSAAASFFYFTYCLEETKGKSMLED